MAEIGEGKVGKRVMLPLRAVCRQSGLGEC